MRISACKIWLWVAMTGMVATPVAGENLDADSTALATAEVPADTLTHENEGERRNFFQKISDYFARSNKYDPSKKIDFGIIGGPFYGSATGFGLGVVASGLYSLDKQDATLPLSNFSIFGNVATSGMLMIGVRGNNLFPQEKYKLDYAAYVYTFPSKFWGIGYENGNNDANERTYSRVKFELKPRFNFRVFDNAYVGAVANFQYVNVSKMDEYAMSMIGGQGLKFFSTGAGITLNYDSRDVVTNATRGWFLQVDQLFYPSFLGNDHVFYLTDFTLSSYHKAWKGAVIAGELHSQFNFEDVPWPMLAQVGGPNRMRGYFEGRYRDKNIIEAQIELRQHLWRRNGAVLWVGAANVFPAFKDMRWRQTLWNFGVGYRWAFKQGVNVRLDLGFTKNGLGFAFNINEAF